MLQSVFDAVDEDGSGRIDRDELMVRPYAVFSHVDRVFTFYKSLDLKLCLNFSSFIILFLIVRINMFRR